MEIKYDLLVIGGGPGGYVAAIKAAQLGMKVALVEASDIGGTCLNWGCIPTKALLHSSNLYYQGQKLGEFGIGAKDITFDMEKIHQRKSTIVENLRVGIERLLKSNAIDIIVGRASIKNEKLVSVEKNGKNQEIMAEKILIATGSRPIKPPIDGIELPGVLYSNDLLGDQGNFYKRILIIGGGVIGVEFASIYQELGSEVVLVEAADTLLPNMDKEISRSLAMSLKRKKVKIHTRSMVQKIEKEGDFLEVTFIEKEKQVKVQTDVVLLAVGRSANLDILRGLQDNLEIETHKTGIKVNENFETSLGGVYAVGDVIGGIQLAHLASAQGIVAVEKMNNMEGSVDLNVIPSCIYTSPEIASVGMTEKEAKDAGIDIEVGKFLMLGNGRTMISDGERGFIKAVFEKDSDKIIGAQLMCERATDLVGEFSQAIVNKLSKKQIGAVIRPHPSYAESITEAIDNAYGQGIHTAPKRKR